MKTHIGIKTILSLPMTRKEYNDYRGWEVPSDENPNDKGYLVEHTNSPNSNHPNHKGYISWSPGGVFNESYKSSGNLSFSHALEALKQGHKVSRVGWNGKGMWIKLIEGRVIEDPEYKSEFINEKGDLHVCSHINMFSADKKQVVGWAPSQTDMLSEDWCIVE